AVARDAAGHVTISATVTVAVANVVVPPPPPPSGLIVAYGFDEGSGTTLSDASGNGLAGTVSNAAWTTGQFGGALQFNGSFNSMVTAASSPLLQLTDAFTVSAWVNPA